EGPTTSAVAPMLWEALHEAVLGTHAEWARAIEHASSADEVSALLAQLSQAIRAAASRQQDEWAPAPRTPRSRRRRGMIRGAFLDRAQGLAGVESAQLLRLLQAVEVVGRGLEADWSQHFADRLSAPDGLELVVEVAHDLRSPLTSILFLAETLQRGRS